MADLTMLEILATVLSASIVSLILIHQKVLVKKAKCSKSPFYIALAMLFALFYILLSEFQENITVPFADILSVIAQIAMLFFSLNALLIVHREEHKKKCA